jgi:hypothetical protein
MCVARTIWLELMYHSRYISHMFNNFFQEQIKITHIKHNVNNNYHLIIISFSVYSLPWPSKTT